MITIPQLRTDRQTEWQTDRRTDRRLAVAIGEIAYKWYRLKTVYRIRIYENKKNLTKQCTEFQHVAPCKTQRKSVSIQGRISEWTCMNLCKKTFCFFKSLILPTFLWYIVSAHASCLVASSGWFPVRQATNQPTASQTYVCGLRTILSRTPIHLVCKREREREEREREK